MILDLSKYSPEPFPDFASDAVFKEWLADKFDRSQDEIFGDGALSISWLKSALGPMIVISDDKSIHLLEFTDRAILSRELKSMLKLSGGKFSNDRLKPMDQIEAELEHYYAGQLTVFKTPVSFHGSEFTCSVWQALMRIPFGEHRSYSEHAAIIGKPAAVRAVGRANGANPVAVVVPCHRLIGANGSLVKYGGGLWRKEALLDMEKQIKDEQDGE
jgi:AraC family transcriptional regulator of adaptative response/methylated-DNA-[protein]-cysteine methyltransferase